MSGPKFVVLIQTPSEGTFVDALVSSLESNDRAAYLG